MRISLATEAASARRPNEDFAAATDDVIVLLDGATAPGTLETGCCHGTRWFARQLGSEILLRVISRPGASLADSLAEAIKELADRHSATCDIAHPGHPSSTVTLVREHPHGYDYLVLADSTLVIETEDEIKSITDNRLAQVATEQRQALRASRPGTADRDAAFAEVTSVLRQHRNRPGGFWVAAADPEAAYQAITGTADRDAVRSIAAMTDGASVVVDRFGSLDWAEAVSLLHESGPDALIRLVRILESSDVTCQRWPRSKPHDDATAVFALPG
jgi:hypothetical protein